MSGDEARRIREADRFGAFVAVRPDPLSAGGLLGGAAIAVKDNIAVAGLPFTAGQPLFAGRVANIDAEAVRRLRSAGGRIIGVTETDAGGFGVMTPKVINPVAPGLTAVGSSGGAAAAVAAGLAALGLGTDTGGSVRIPAACCGLFGFKPSWGRVPHKGVWPLAERFDHVGLLARDFDLLRRGAAALLLGDMDAGRSVQSVGLDVQRLAYAAPNIRSAVLDMVESMKASGLSIKLVTLPDIKKVVAAHGVLVLVAARTIYDRFGPEQIDLLATTARRSLAAAEALDKRAITAAEDIALQCISDLNGTLAEVDVILTPTLLIDPPPRGAHRIILAGREVPVVAGLVAETCLANVTGCPAIALPLGPKNPVPVSFQLMAARGDDARLIEFAGTLADIVTARAQ